MKTHQEKVICKRTDTGVVALMFDEQEGKYYALPFPNTLEYLRTSELEDYSPRFRPVAYIEVSNDERGNPKEGKQVPLNETNVSTGVKSQKEIEAEIGRLTQEKKRLDEEFSAALEQKKEPTTCRLIKINANYIQLKIDVLLWAIGMNDKL